MKTTKKFDPQNTFQKESKKQMEAWNKLSQKLQKLQKLLNALKPITRLNPCLNVVQLPPKPLTAYDFIYHIQIKHQDQSTFDLPNSTFSQNNSQLFVYTEHCGYFMFFKEDLELFRFKENKENKDTKNKSKWITQIKQKW